MNFKLMNQFFAQITLLVRDYRAFFNDEGKHGNFAGCAAKQRICLAGCVAKIIHLDISEAQDILEGKDEQT